MRRIPILFATVGAAVFAMVSPAWACGSLVAPNGAVQLVRTTTLAAWHDGVEHYVTNFEFAGNQPSFGSIIPLPAEPTKVERGGDWTLQRLEREVNPLPREVLAQADRASAGKVDVLRQTRIDSLDVTILRGGGKDVAAWAKAQGFALTKDTPAVLDFYSRRSPYFMAAKFDASAAVARGLDSGDGIPVQLTMPIDRPWVPLRILATGKPADEIVNADVFLLTDRKPELLTGPGLSLERSVPARAALLDDLRSDKRMDWVPTGDMWLTYLRVNVKAGDLGYDLAADASGKAPRVVDTGVAYAAGLRSPDATLGHSAGWRNVAIVVAALAAVVVGTAVSRARRAPAPRP
jgi:hypothetical protein